MIKNILNLFVNDLGYRKSALFVVALTVLNFGISIILNYFIPKLLLPIEFGKWRLYLLIVSFSGLAHIGFSDGIFLKWLKISNKEIDEQFLPNFLKLLIQQIIFASVVYLIVSRIQTISSIAINISLQIVFINLLGFVQFYLQAKKKFLLNTLIIILSQFTLFLLVAVFSNYIKNDPNRLILLSHVQLIIAIVITFFIVRSNLDIASFNFSKFLSFKRLSINHVKIGLPILLSGIIFHTILTLDKIVVVNFYSDYDFGIYSFASTIVGIVFTLVFALTNIILKYLFENSQIQKVKFYNKAISWISLIWMLIILVMPIISKLISEILPNYNEAGLYLVSLSGIVGSVCAIQTLQANIFKNAQKQNLLLIITSFILGISSIALYFIAKENSALSIIPIFLSAIFLLWFFINEYFLFKKVDKSYLNGFYIRITKFTSVYSIYIVTIYLI